MNAGEIEANLGRVVRVRTADEEWEGVVERLSADNIHWQVTRPDGQTVAVTASQILGLKVAPANGASGLPPAGAGNLPNESWGLADLASFIVASFRRTSEDAWWIGQALDIGRAKHKAVRHFLRWLREDVAGLSKSTAYRYMDLCTTFTLEEVRGKPLVVLYKLMEDQRKDDDSDEEDRDDGTGAEEPDGADRESADDDAADDGGQEEPATAGKIASSTPSGAGTEGRDDKDDEIEPPVTDIEIDALAVFVEAVGGLTRAEYVFSEGIKQLRELKDET